MQASAVSIPALAWRDARFGSWAQPAPARPTYPGERGNCPSYLGVSCKAALSTGVDGLDMAAQRAIAQVSGLIERSHFLRRRFTGGSQ